jgi:hypothetical protein
MSFSVVMNEMGWYVVNRSAFLLKHGEPIESVRAVCLAEAGENLKQKYFANKGDFGIEEGAWERIACLECANLPPTIMSFSAGWPGWEDFFKELFKDKEE